MVIPWICFAKRSINWRRNLNNAGSCWKKLSKKSSREKMEIGCSGICRILSGLSLIISMTVWERRKTFNTVTEHKTTGNTKTHIQRFELIRPVLFWCLLQPVQDRIPEKCWEEGLQNPEWSRYVQFQRAAQIELWTGQKCDAKRIKGDYPGGKWEGADGMIL